MKKADLILIITIISLMSMVYLIYQLIPKTNASDVIITSDGRQYKKVSLTQNESVVIENKDHHNIIMIENGQAYMKEANCPDQICVKHSPIKNNGEIIICLPNRITIEVSN